MIDEIQTLLDDYLSWLRDRTVLREVNDCVEITTPYLDRHNDYLQIYAKRANGGFLLTDDGYVVDDLEQCGCKIDSGKRSELVHTTLRGFGVELRKKAIEVRASKEDFQLRKHSLVQAMLAVNDLFYLAQPSVASLFVEDVTNWLDEAEVRYTPNVRFAGASTYDHRFDFVIPKSGTHPERVVRSINRPGRDMAQAAAFAWMDTRESRPAESRAYAILNDSDKAVPDIILAALRNYDVGPVLWSEREQARSELAA